MSEEDTNIDNPLNRRCDLEERNEPHVTPIPAEAEADDLFDDSGGEGESVTEKEHDRTPARPKLRR